MYKNQLQELAQRSCFNLPFYACIREGPDHAPRFRATVNFNGEVFESPTFCNTLRQAEHAAAEAALHVLSKNGPSKALAAKVLDETGVYKNLLQETAHRAGLKLPIYTTIRSGPGHVPVFFCTVDIAKMSFKGEPAKTKKQAQKNAAMAAWSALKQLSQFSSSSTLDSGVSDELEQVTVARCLASLRPPEATRTTERDRVLGRGCATGRRESMPNDNTVSLYSMNCTDFTHSAPLIGLDETGVYKNLLQETAHRAGLKLPIYTTIRSGPGHVPVFFCTVDIAKMSFKGEPAKTKKQAQKNAAMAAWSALKQLSQFSSSSTLDSGVSDELEQVTVARCLASLRPPEATRTTERDRVLGRGCATGRRESMPNDNTVSLYSMNCTDFTHSAPLIGLDETGVYKNLLQETAHRAGLKLPIYTTIRSGPGHVPVFFCTVDIAKMSFKGEPAKTKKQAQKNAAMAAWSALKQLSQFSSSSTLDSGVSDELEQVTVARCLASLRPPEATRTTERDRVLGRGCATGRRESMPNDNTVSLYSMNCTDFTHSAPLIGLDETGVYKNLLQETAHRAGLKLPIYTTIRSGPGHVPVFFCTVDIAKMSFKGEPAKTKKQAQKNAAMAAWSALKQLSQFSSSSTLDSGVSDELEQVTVARCLASLRPPEATRTTERDRVLGRGCATGRRESMPNDNTVSLYSMNCTDFTHSAPLIGLDETGVYKNLLQETAHRAGLKLPIYTTIRSGPGHVPVFFCTVDIAKMSFKGEPAKTKKQAQKNAAMAAWSALKQLSQFSSSSTLDSGVSDELEQVTVARCLASLRPPEATRTTERDRVLGRGCATGRRESMPNDNTVSLYSMNCTDFTHSAPLIGLAHRSWPVGRESQQQTHPWVSPHIQPNFQPERRPHFLPTDLEPAPPAIGPFLCFSNGSMPVPISNLSRVTVQETEEKEKPTVEQERPNVDVNSCCWETNFPSHASTSSAARIRSNDPSSSIRNLRPTSSSSFPSAPTRYAAPTWSPRPTPEGAIYSAGLRPYGSFMAPAVNIRSIVPVCSTPPSKDRTGSSQEGRLGRRQVQRLAK